MMQPQPRSSMVALTLLLVGAAGCAAGVDSPLPQDDPADVDPKSDLTPDRKTGGGGTVWGIAEGSPDAIGVLKVANTLSEDDLHDRARVAWVSAFFIVQARQSHPIRTLHELDDVYFVGQKTFGHLLAFARANGYVPVGDAGVDGPPPKTDAPPPPPPDAPMTPDAPLPSCGNGVLDPGETCDTGIAAGQRGACPTSCDDGDACTTDTLLDGGTCMARCTHTPITQPVDGDGCCPAGANPSDDSDCAASCGDGVVTPPETCDTGIAAGRPGACPTSCDDGNACTTDTLLNGGTCTAACAHAPITLPANGDGCCPRGANANDDSDCAPVCGNGVVEPGEQCDDGNTTSGDGCSSTCTAEPTAFRMNSMSLVDPHIFASALGCSDLTSFVNTTLNNNLTGDANGDGFLDLSPVVLFVPLAQSAPTSTLDFLLGQCVKDGSSCSSGGATTYSATETNLATGVCADGAGHNPAYGAVNTPTNNCFASDSETLAISLQGVLLTLQDARIAAVYGGNPATGLTTGLVRGFLSKADADAITLPSSVPIVGGQPLSSLLGSTTNCPSHNDLDTFNGQPGWYFYLDFTATKTAYTP